MDAKIETLGYIINLLKDDIDEAKSELNRLTFVDEEAEPASASDNLTTNPTAGPQFGTVILPIHFTLGRGVSEALGDRVDQAVFKAFREVTAGEKWGQNHREMDFRGIGIAIELYWDRDNQCACLHLDLVKTDHSLEMEEFGEEIAMPQGRSLN